MYNIVGALFNDESEARQAMAALDRTMLLLERNVNQKILFCDLVGRMYFSF